MSRRKAPELKSPEAPAVPRDANGRILPGATGNPGGQSREKRAFLDRLTIDDATEIYEKFMALVREGNVPAILLAVQYNAGKPKAAKEDNEALKAAGLTIVVQRLDEPKEGA